MITNSGSANGTVQYVHDRMGNIIAEATSAGATAREFIWLPEAEIAPTFQSRAQVDRPVAVVEGVNTASPQTWYVAVDHLHRPIRMTNAAKAVMWSATWTPWGAPHAITGAAVLDARFPGQWFQLESGLHYNWHRHYDPTLGRYTQPDPLGFVDGPSVYGYAKSGPVGYIDRDGRLVLFGGGGATWSVGPGFTGVTGVAYEVGSGTTTSYTSGGTAWGYEASAGGTIGFYTGDLGGFSGLTYGLQVNLPGNVGITISWNSGGWGVSFDYGRGLGGSFTITDTCFGFGCVPDLRKTNPRCIFGGCPPDVRVRQCKTKS